MDAFIEFMFLGKIIAAAFLGGLVGIEREFAEKPAGLRTHILVCATSTLLVTLATQMVLSFEPEGLINTDPVRVVEAIIVGISFLGAGTIIKHSRERTVEGLTTSASILSVAAIGIAVALNAFILAIGVSHPVESVHQLGSRIHRRPGKSQDRLIVGNYSACI